MDRPVRLLSVAVIGTAGLWLTACGGDRPAKAVATPPSASTAAAQATATATGPATATRPTREVELVTAVRPRIDRLTEALKKNDLAAAQQAYEAYDAGWNGIEVYVNFRSRDLYNALEQDLQAKIADGLAAKAPRPSDLVPVSEALAKKYDEAIALSKTGPALSPLFDDLATLRTVRADLRIATAALTASDLPKARTAFTAFKGNYGQAQPLIKVRSGAAESEVADALNKADAGFQAAAPSVETVKPLVAALTERYNYGVNLLNAAARNADLAKTAFTETDTQSLAALNDISRSLRLSMTAWEAGTYPAATQHASAAGGTQFAVVKPVLAAKSADATLKTALDGYATLAGAAGDAAKVRAANKAALEAVTIAQQVLVGQFWTDAKLQTFLAGLPKT